MQKQQSSNRIYDQQAVNHSRKFAKDKSSKQVRKYLRFLVLVFIGIIILTIGFQIPILISKFQKPFPYIQSKFARYSSVELTHRINILLVTDDGNNLTEVGLISLEKGDRKIRLLKIDPQSKIQSEDFSGTLSELAFKDGKISIDSIETALIGILGYFIDGYIVTSDKIQWVNETSIEKLINDFYSISFFLNITKNKDYMDQKIRTNMTLNQTNKLIWFSKGLPPKRVELTDLSKTKNSDGFIDAEVAGNKIGLMLSDSSVSKEETAIEIVNSSNVAGIGTIFKKVVTNLGGNVLNVSKAAATEKSSILIKDKESNLSKRLSTIFGVKVEKIRKGEHLEADIKLIIGNEYANLFDF